MKVINRTFYLGRFFGIWSLAFLIFGISACKCTPNRKETTGKKTFYFRNELSAKTLDPARMYDAASSSAVVLIFDALYAFHYLKRPFELVPNLTTTLPDYGPDGKVMKIELRDDVWFHDNKCFEGGKGRKFKASDVVYTLNRFADSTVNDQGSINLLEGLIEGLDTYITKTKAEGWKADYQMDFISGVHEVDDRHLEIKLTKPTSVVFNVLSNPILSIVPKECVDYYGLDFGFNPVGTGPFTISYKNRKGDMILQKNRKYHLKYPSEGEPGDAEKGLLVDAGKSLPLVDEVVLPVIEEPLPAMLKFKRGDLDWVRVDADSFRSMVVKNADASFTLKPPGDKLYELFPATDLASSWWVFNMKDDVVGRNLLLRKAMAYAIDRQGYVDDVYNGRGQVIDSMIPSSLPGSARSLGLSWYPYDPKEAKKLLAQAGYPEGKGLPTLRLLYVATASIQKQYEYVRRNFAEIGIKLELDTAPYSAFNEKFSKGGFQFSIGGWNADYLDPENFLMLFTKGAIANELMYGGGWSHPQFEAMFKKVVSLSNGPERFEVIKRMTELVKEDVPYIPQFTYYRIGVKAPWLRKWKRNVADDREAVYVDIDQDLRAKGYEP